MNGEERGRLRCSIRAEEISEISVHIGELQLEDLPAVETNLTNGLHPYLKYQFSQNWPAVRSGHLKAVYSEIRHRSLSPMWEDLPVLRFHSSLREMFTNSIQVHINHKAQVRHIPVARANLLFRTLISRGHVFKEQDRIKFNGTLRANNARIKGWLRLFGLPHFAQGSAARAGRPLHTEAGLLNFKPLLPWVTKPDLEIIKQRDDDTISDSEDNRKVKRAASDDLHDKIAAMRHATDSKMPKSEKQGKTSPKPDDSNGDENSAEDSFSMSSTEGDDLRPAKDAPALSLPKRSRSRSVGDLSSALQDRPNHHEKHHAAELIVFDDDFAGPGSLPEPSNSAVLAEVGVATGLAELVLDPNFEPPLDTSNPFR